MFTSIVFTAVLASSSALLSHAIVSPNEPGPGESFNQGTKCHIGWAGDDSGSTTAWKNMAIELMTGSNEKMVHITTVATDQDGTVAGTFDYDCPEVTPNSPIYFYQFTSGGTPNVTWTTRFTIAGADGSSTPATDSEKAADGTTVGIGNGALVDPSTAVPAPTFNSTTGGSSGSSGANSASADPNSASNAPSNAPSVTPGTPSNSASQKPSGAAGQTSAPLKSNAASNSASAPSQSGSSAAVAVGPMVLDTRVWPFVVALTACASAFTILL